MTDVIFGSGTIILWFLLAVFFLVPRVRSHVKKLFISNKILASRLVLILALIAMLGSLWYSDVVGFEPCRLCWYQRIFMYPIVLISFIGLVYDDLRSLIYVRVLAIVGLVISLFHIIEQRVPQAGLSCGSVGQAARCDSLWVNAFNIVTIPTMAFTIFLAIIIITLIQGWSAKDSIK